MTDPPARQTVFARRLGELIRRERTIAGMTQLALAERSGVSQATIARWERGTRTTSLEQVDRALAALHLQLRLDVETRVDPLASWHAEAIRLASLTPDQRLAETKLPLVMLIASARRYGADALIDGALASRLQGMPGQPRSMALAIPPGAVEQWINLRPVVRGPVDQDLMFLRIPRSEMPELFRREGGGLLSTIFGFVELRVLESDPATTRLTLQDEMAELTNDVEAISLADLPAYLSTPQP